jgi:error-prone DNA polymerase
VLEKTLGVPLFQEQAMNIAIVGAGFTASEADQLRRAMATFRRVGTIHLFRDKFICGMAANGYPRDFAERCFKQIEGFGTYGFPESHATSFALLVYISSWLKCHHPAAFACALLNSQPMGFYAPAQIVRDARDHGVAVLPVDVNASAWDCTLEPAPGSSDAALRLGFRQVKGLQQAEMEHLVARRGNGYPDLAALRRRAEIGAGALDRLARADAFGSLALARRGALWSAIGLDRTGQELDQPPLFAWAEGAARAEPEIALPSMTLGEEVAQDYANLRLSLRCHPLALLRPWFGRAVRAEQLAGMANGRRVEVAGLTLVRQRPGTASGVIFVTLEDETGVANLVVWPSIFERYRRVVLGAQLMIVRGRLQREGIVIHVVAETLIDRSDLLARLGETGPFRAPVAHADHAKSSGPPDPRDPFWRPRDLDHLRSHPHIYQGLLGSPEARPAKRATAKLDPRDAGFKSRDFR